MESGEQFSRPPSTFDEIDVQHLLAEASRTWDVLQNDLEVQHLRRA